MTQAPSVLVIDDQVGEILWLLSDLQERGYDVVLATNERAARERLRAVREGKEAFVLAIVDIAVAVMSIEDLVAEHRELDEAFFDDSVDTGLRLCTYARKELRLTAEELPIVCLSVRVGDETVKTQLGKLGIRAFERTPEDPAQSVRAYLNANLPSIAGE